MKKEAKRGTAAPNTAKRRKTLPIVILTVALLVCAAVAGVLLYKQSQIKTYVAQQNYVASKLLEMGSYDAGRTLAEQTEQKSENDISKVLIVLAAGFSTDFDEALELTALFSAQTDTAFLREAETAVNAAIVRTTPTEGSVESFMGMPDTVLDDVTRNELLAILLRVQGEIKVKKTAASLLAMQELLTTGYLDPATKEALADDSSLLAKKVQMLSAIRDNDYEAAYGAAEALFAKDSSFENRAALANLAATGYVSVIAAAESDSLSAQQEKLNGLYSRYSTLQMEYYNASDEKTLKDLSDQMQQTEADIAAVQAEIVREPVKRAINFIETTTPLTQRNTAMYNIELSQLYYRAGNEEKASDLLIGTLTEFGSAEPNSVRNAVDRNLNALVTHYRDAQEYGQTDTQNKIWNRIADILGILDVSRNTGGYYGQNLSGTSYYDFVLRILSRVYRGLTIRSIDASDFPVVRVVVNVATDDSKSTNMKKNDFTVLDMNKQVSHRILDANDAELGEALSVMLVIDRSGSMSGAPMTDTKNAVMNFVRETSDTAALGITVFDNAAQIVAPLGSARTELLRVTDAITDGGGTNIQAGLSTACEALSSTVGRRVVILLSDGSDGNASGIDAVLDELAAHNISVYTIGISGADTDYLSYIADRSGGKFLAADSSALLSDIYASIGEYMVNDYILEFDASTDIENFVRDLQIRAETSGALTDSPYNVGVSLEDILAEANQTPAYNSYRQTGGSAY